jgi:hypothetical protein
MESRNTSSVWVVGIDHP